MRKYVLAAFAAMLVAAQPAAAHVTIAPNSAAAGSWTTFTVKVPNESDTASTTKVALKMPPGITTASYEPVPGWNVAVTKSKLAAPVKTEDGTVTEGVDSVTWTATGGGIKPGQFQGFGLTLPVPQVAGQTLTFKAVQTYDDGKVSRWIGAPTAEEPAPTVQVTAPDDEAGHSMGAGSESGSHSETDTLTWVALGLAVLATALAGAALLRSRRK